LEDCAATVEWNPLQLFAYPKQLLSGAAKMFVRSQRNIKDWAIGFGGGVRNQVILSRSLSQVGKTIAA